MHPRPRIVALVMLAACGVLTAAAPPARDSAEDAVRRANAALAAGDRDEAARLYAVAEGLTTDPGLVAFNQAAVLFQKGDFREAEVHYARVLDDAACPPERAARAWYNRGTCLLRRGGPAAVYRSAIACLERCVDAPAADEPLRADARHNLEVAKALWNEARKADAKERPNSPPPPEDPRTEPQPKPEKATEPETSPDTGEPGGKKTGEQPKVGPQAADPVPGKVDDPTAAPVQGAPSPAPQLQNDDAVQQLSPDDTRAHLRKIAERLDKDRRDLRRTLSPPILPGVRDW